MIQTERFIFQENPRCGSTAISNELLKEPGAMRITPRHEPQLRGASDHRLVFCVVRNPYDRFNSLWHYDDSAPERFLDWFEKDNLYQRVSQVYWTQGCDFYLKFENLYKEFNRVMRSLDQDFRLEPHEPRVYPSLPGWEKQKIQQAVPQDFTKFGY